MSRKLGRRSAALAIGPSLIVLATQAGLAQDSSFYRENRFRGGFSGGDLNISSYVFRDVNRNGEFDLGDRAMAHVAVEMSCQDGARRVRRSNVAGFTNFTMSVRDRKADIVNEGRCRFEAKLPSGWELTTANADQERRFRVLPGAPADLVALDPSEPIGLAPALTISGQITSPGPQAVSLTAISPEGDAEQVAVDDEGDFAFDAGPGVWVLEIDAGRDATIRRVAEVRDTPVLLSAIGDDFVEADAAPAGTTVTFDDLIGTRAIAEVPSGIGGVGWRNWVLAHNVFYQGEGYVNATVSGEYVAYNSSGHPAEIYREEPFDFVGGYFAAAWHDAEGETLQVTGWRGDEIVYRDRMDLSALGPVYFTADYRDVTRIEFATEHYWQFVADDLSFRVGN